MREGRGFCARTAAPCTGDAFSVERAARERPTSVGRLELERAPSDAIPHCRPTVPSVGVSLRGRVRQAWR